MRNVRTSRLERMAAMILPATAVISLFTTGLVGAAGRVGAVSAPKPVVQEHMTDLSGEAASLSATRSVRQIDTGISTDMVGFDWPGTTPGIIQVRALAAGGWSDWTSIDANLAEGPDANSREFHLRMSAGPLWVGRGIKTIQFKIATGQLPGLRLHAIRTDVGSGIAQASASASVGQPGIISRAGWGADESWRAHNGQGCLTPSYADNVTFMVVHHTVQSNNYGPGDSASLVRGDYYYHVFTNGWCDIGYNFLVDLYGQIFEGRYGGITRAVIGAHAGGFNTNSSGVALLGTFDTAGPSSAMWNSLRALLTWKAAYHGINPQGNVTVTTGNFPTTRWPPGTVVTIPTIIGHRDVDQTDCPGQTMYPLLPQLRAEVAAGFAAGGGQLSDSRLVCDWTGSGVATPAVYQGGVFYIRLSNSPGPADLVIPFGIPGDQAVCGDWTAHGVESIGIVRQGTWYLRTSNTFGPAEIVFNYGNPGDTPIVGKWKGGGTLPGIYRGGTWYLRNSLTTGGGDVQFNFGNPSDLPVVGNWAGSGIDTPGVNRQGIWYLRNTNTTGVGDTTLALGNPGDRPMAGAWVSGSTDTPGVTRGGFWYERNSLTSGPADQAFLY
jgi:hypothetical protein